MVSGEVLPAVEGSTVVEETDLSKSHVNRKLDVLESRELVERKRRRMGNVVVLKRAQQKGFFAEQKITKMSPENRYDYIVGVAALVPGILVGGFLGGYVAYLAFSGMASLPFDLPVFVVLAVSLAVFASVVVTSSVAFARLYYALGLPSKLGDV
jgi:DNA-binding transcriptional ArsR family regulator